MAEALAPIELAGRTVLVAGAKVAGASAARAALRHGAQVLIADATAPPDLAALTDVGARFVGGVQTLPAGTELVVTSPGFAPAHPLLQHAHLCGVPVLGEVEFAWQLRRTGAAQWLALTGTNGKTTTVRMLESMLIAAGLRAKAVGNVGVSIIDAVDGPDELDVLAVELSSYQLHWSSTLRPRAGAILNLAPDHLDWHGDMERYGQAKAKIWNAEVMIANADDPLVMQLLEQKRLRHPAGAVLTFTLSPPAFGQWGIDGGWLMDHCERAPEPVIPAQDVRPSGKHNVANALAAAALARAAGISHEAIAQGLRQFVPDPHRNQPLGVRDGVSYVDDSKATNAHAAAASMESYRSIVWIAGGQLKNAPVDDLVARFADRLRAAVLLGADREVIAQALARHAPNVPVIMVASTDDSAMTVVVAAAREHALPGDTVLLAPAAASYDMFTGYPARGAAFAAAILAGGPLDAGSGSAASQS